jgi:hypothetical protein
MKAKDYKGITNLLEQKNPNKRFFTFMDFEDTQARIDYPKIYQYPIQQNYQKPKKTTNYYILFVLVLYILWLLI